MAQPSRFPWPRTSAGLEIVPPTLLIVKDYPWLGAGALGAVLVASAVQSRMAARSAQERHQAILSYARDATSMGGDPTAVIAALQRRTDDAEDDGVPPELPLRGHKEGRDPAVPWFHRVPRV